MAEEQVQRARWRTVERVHDTSGRVMDTIEQLADRAASVVNEPPWIDRPEEQVLALRARLDAEWSAFQDALREAERAPL
jgi:hypothetical protein